MNDTRPLAEAPDYLQRQKTRVRIVTPSGVVEGDHSHPPGVRLSDSLRNASSSERFLVLGNATMRSLAGEELPLTEASSFVMVNTAHTSIIIPLDEHGPGLNARHAAATPPTGAESIRPRARA
jgi:hypothetical protein